MPSLNQILPVVAALLLSLALLAPAYLRQTAPQVAQSSCLAWALWLGGALCLIFAMTLLQASAWSQGLASVGYGAALMLPIAHRLRRNIDQTADALLRLETLFSALPDAIYFSDAQGRLLAVNAAGQKLFGLSGMDWKHKTLEQLRAQISPSNPIHLDWHGSIRHEERKSAQVLTHRIVQETENQPRHFEISNIPLRLESESSDPALITVGRDITERFQGEQELRLAASIFEHSPEGIMITSATERPVILRVNQSFQQITGFSAQEVQGKNPNILSSGIHDRAFFQAMWHILLTTGHWEGEIWNVRRDGTLFPEWINISAVQDSSGKTTHYVGVFEDITEIKRTQHQLEEAANHDPLTGLPNRRLLNELLEHAIRRASREQSRVAVLFIDLDRFKIVNDSLGHVVGDTLLAMVAERIQQAVRNSDLIARLGGDEFVVVMDGLQEGEDATVVAQKIIDSLTEPFYAQEHEIFIGASIGISLCPEDGQEPAELIKAADIAMYQVKNQGQGSYCFYSKILSANRQERFVLENDLRHAVERRQFELFYQPQVRLSDGKILGAEALVRWRHPQLGLVSPARFIPLAEETGLILSIGEWVLRQAAQQAKIWSERGLQALAVNVSGVQILRSNFSDTVYGVLVETGCDASLLELEITESSVMHNTEHVISCIDRLKQLGVQLAIDDFGTGYSSMSHLKRLRLNKLKIDQSFVRDLPSNSQDAAIARAILALGHSLDLTVTAEGVETLAQAEFLRALGCNHAQGYYFGKPMAAHEFDRLLGKGKGSL